MAKFFKIQDYYINVEQISYVEIMGSGDNKSAAIYVTDRHESINFRTPKAEQYKLTSQEIEMLEKFLIQNTI